MKISEFNEQFGPEWHLTVHRGTVHLDNIVPMYMAVVKMGEWSVEKFGSWIPIPDDEEERERAQREYADWLAGLVVPDEVVAVAMRARILILSDGNTRRYFDVSTNDKLQAAALSGLTWLWNNGRFLEPVAPEKPEYSLQYINSHADMPLSLKKLAKEEIQRYLDRKQMYDRDMIVYMDVKNVVENKRGGGAWAIVNGMRLGVVEFLE
jgi:hypothetical protein